MWQYLNLLEKLWKDNSSAAFSEHDDNGDYGVIALSSRFFPEFLEDGMRKRCCVGSLYYVACHTTQTRQYAKASR